MGGEGGGTEYLLCETRKEAKLSATGHVINFLRVFVCVHREAALKVPSWSQKGMIWLRGSAADESGNRKLGR